MTEQPTRDHLLHLVDRARRGVALPAELDALATGVGALDQLRADLDRVQQAACRTAETLRHAEERIATAEAASATHRALLEEARDALEAAGANGAHGDDWPRLAPAIEELAERARTAEAAIERVENLRTIAPDGAQGPTWAALDLAIRDALDEPQSSTTTA